MNDLHAFGSEKTALKLFLKIFDTTGKGFSFIY